MLSFPISAFSEINQLNIRHNGQVDDSVAKLAQSGKARVHDQESMSYRKFAGSVTSVKKPSGDERSSENVISSRSTLDVANPDRSVKSESVNEAGLHSLLKSKRINKFLLSAYHGEILKQFYAQNDHQMFWISDGDFNWRANAIIKEIQRAPNYGLRISDFSTPAVKPNPSELAKAELLLSSNILQYVHQAEGGRLDPRKLSKDIDRGPHLTKPRQVLNGIVRQSAPDKYLRSFHPKHAQFEALRKKYITLRNIASRQSEVQKILVNMERWRWMPKNLGQFHIWASIPEFRMRVVKNNQVIHEANIVVGKISNKTPVFSDKMEYLVFHPYWNVPNSIKAAEIMPKLRRSTNIIQKQNLGVRIQGKDVNPYQVNWRSVDPSSFDFYQPPKRKNVLGTLKFMFPNKHSVYMHDTPSRHLLNRKLRLYSHGCMRVQNPEKLAAILLNRDRGWPKSQVNYHIQNRVNKRVDLSRSIPVHITYFTAWIGSEGGLKLYDDYYGHDRLIADHLFGKSNLIPTARYTVTSINETGYQSSSQQQVSDTNTPNFKPQIPDRVARD